MEIKKADRTALKSYFVKNAIPTESHFADLVDAGLNQKDDGIAKLPGEPLSLQAEGADNSLKKAINFYRSFADAKPAWTVSLNPRGNPAVPGTARAGWSIGDGDGNSRLFIDQGTGNIGIGTVDTGPYRLSVAGTTLFEGDYLFVHSEKAGRLRVGAAWGMPGLYSSDDGPKPLVLGVPAGQRVYFGVAKNDAYVEGGTGHAFFRGNLVASTLKVGAGTPVESVDTLGRVRAGGLSMGPWPANGTYGFVGVNTLNQADGGNYALLQGTTDGPGRTFLNSPVDIRFRIRNADQMVLTTDGNFGVGTNDPKGKLHVHTGGAGAWDRFVVKTTQLWGDPGREYVTIGEGGASGIMMYNPHVVWYPPESRASIRLGRSDGKADGHWWDVGVRTKNEFSIINGHTGASLHISQDGIVTVGALQLGRKWKLSGVGDPQANDDWLRLLDQKGPAYYGGFAAGRLYAIRGVVEGSDVRLKREIVTIDDPTDQLLQLRAVRFR
ncbi:MAG: hypothetical protein AB7N65_17210 [Vicinamibacterales bacterium]